MNRFSILACALPLLLAPAPARAADRAPETGWTSLFNGRNLDGWVQHGGKAVYEADHDQIVGHAVPHTPNSFLCTSRDYTNFILEIEFRIEGELNSGIQIRSHALDHPTQLVHNGKTIKIPAGRVHGYQVEIDPSPRAWSGGIYDESRRGWINDLSRNEPARKAFKKEAWNHYRIEARTGSIKTWINGVPAADLADSLTPSGFIALQVHGVGDKTKPLAVRFRNIRLKELP